MEPVTHLTLTVPLVLFSVTQLHLFNAQMVVVSVQWKCALLNHLLAVLLVKFAALVVNVLSQLHYAPHL